MSPAASVASPEPNSAALRVPGTRLRGVGRHAEHAELAQHLGIVGRAERERGARIARLGRAPQHQPRGRDVALADQLLAALEQHGELLAIECAQARRGRRRLLRQARAARQPARFRLSPEWPRGDPRTQPARNGTTTRSVMTGCGTMRSGLIDGASSGAPACRTGATRAAWRPPHPDLHPAVAAASRRPRRMPQAPQARWRR